MFYRRRWEDLSLEEKKCLVLDDLEMLVGYVTDYQDDQRRQKHIRDFIEELCALVPNPIDKE